MTHHRRFTTALACGLIGAASDQPTLLLMLISLGLIFPIVITTAVLARHARRSTSPGAAGEQLLELVRIILNRPSS
jgi:hypothetical protein